MCKEGPLAVSIFDRMFEISCQENLQHLQQFFINPSRVIDMSLLDNNRYFEYLNFALNNTNFDKKLI